MRAMIWLYNIFIRLYRLGIWVAALRNEKARSWIDGRKHWQAMLRAGRKADARYIWIHCASVGEYEQARPLIESLRRHFPAYEFCISFFSPSGYRQLKRKQGTELLTYLPLDTRSNADRFLNILKPSLAIVIKYEYWYHHISQTADRHIPLLMVSAIFRKEQIFFKWYGGLYRKLLKKYTAIFTQDDRSLDLLKEINITHAIKAGDTRFDRVAEIANQDVHLPLIEKFLEGRDAMIAGSTWPADEAILQMNDEEEMKLIVAPHEITPLHIDELKNRFTDSITYSALENDQSLQRKTLIIDNIGMLSKLYKYGTVAYIGGGFNKSGIHNTLEAAVYSIPLMFGPHFQKFKEARDLISAGGAVSISTVEEFAGQLRLWMIERTKREQAGSIAGSYVQQNRGATKTIVNYIQEKRLLTS